MRAASTVLVLVLLFAQAELRVVDVVDRSAKTNIGVGGCKDKFDQEKCVRAKEMGKCGWDIGRVECRETCGRCAEGRVIVDTEVLAKHKASKNPCGVGPEMEDSMKGVHRGMKDEPVAEHQIQDGMHHLRNTTHKLLRSLTKIQDLPVIAVGGSAKLAKARDFFKEINSIADVAAKRVDSVFNDVETTELAAKKKMADDVHGCMRAKNVSHAEYDQKRKQAKVEYEAAKKSYGRETAERRG